jgi:hypothetical protein
MNPGWLALGFTGVLALVDRRGSRARAPGYNSYAWTTQDWRVVIPGKKPDVTFTHKCGAASNRTKDGRVRLCLPLAVISTLRKTSEGKAILWDQAKKKEQAKAGSRIPWHPKIRQLHCELEARTQADDPSK